MSDNQTKIEADDAVPNSVHIVVMSWFSHVLNDPFVKQWFGWLMTPVVLAFIIPLALILFIYISILILYINRVHHRRLRRRLREAVTERDILKAGRDIVAALWDGQGWLWHGYEVVGLEKIPDVGPALLVYYHGALPLDYYYLVAKVCLLKKRVIHSVVDNFLFHIPGLSVLLSSFSGTPGTVSSCTADLQDGNLLGLSPGGVYEAMFSDQKDYNVQWKNRVGFAKIALEAQIPIIPVFTRNIREAVRTLVTLQNGETQYGLVQGEESEFELVRPSSGSKMIYLKDRQIRFNE